MADWGDFLKKSSGFGGGSMRNEDFHEDVWGTVAKEKKKDYTSPKTRKVSKDNFSSGSSSSYSAAWHQPTSPRKIPRANNSITLPSSDGQVGQGSSSSSAPMVIPDWSKIYGKKGSCVDVGEGDSRCYGNHHNQNDYGDDDDDDEDSMIPPHEWIARRLARSQISSFSVCEGVGRTLKGRDLSKVRNAILTKTGFIE